MPPSIHSPSMPSPLLSPNMVHLGASPQEYGSLDMRRQHSYSGYPSMDANPGFHYQGTAVYKAVE
jgi:hypothetical protein